MNKFNFNFSLSILNHLGRNLYRSFITILGEAISNSWDAEADNVHIFLDSDNNNFVIIDDGNGMTEKDFQEKFLKIGYSKRKTNDGLIHRSPNKERPYIGRKGIGKLALLSGADKIHILSKTSTMKDFIGGMIDNSKLDDTIENDGEQGDYQLENVNNELLNLYKSKIEKGTILFFENVNGGINNHIDYIRKIIALYFRFSLNDNNFKIYVDDEEIGTKDLTELCDNTQFIWRINNFQDPLFSEYKHIINNKTINSNNANIGGFIASVIVPSNLTIRGLKEKVGIDLYVNGRLREKNFVNNIKLNRIPESYMYGQIHYNILDESNEDAFTSSREGVKEDNQLYAEFIKNFEQDIYRNVIDEWDKLRLLNKQQGDSDNNRKSKKDRASDTLVHEIIGGYIPNKKDKNHDKCEKWVEELENDANFNVQSYVEAFISENLLRKYIIDSECDLDLKEQESKEKPSDIINNIKSYEERDKIKAGINFQIRKSGNKNLNYVDQEVLFEITRVNSKIKNAKHPLRTIRHHYSLVRNAVMHTALLTKESKNLLTITYANLKAGIQKLLSDNNQ